MLRSNKKTIVVLSIMLLFLFSAVTYASVTRYSMSYNLQNDFYSGSCPTEYYGITSSYVEQVNCDDLSNGSESRSYVRLDYDVTGEYRIIGWATTVDVDYLWYNPVYSGGSGAEPHLVTDQHGDKVTTIVNFCVEHGDGYVDFYLPFEWRTSSGNYTWDDNEFDPGSFSSVGQNIEVGSTQFSESYSYKKIYLSSSGL